MIRGDNSLGIQYVVEMDDSGDLYVLYLVSRYGKRATALTARNIFMTRNEKVMALWSKYSAEWGVLAFGVLVETSPGV